MDEKILEKKVEDMALSAKASKFLQMIGCKTVGDTLNLSEDTILSYAGLKVKNEIVSKLAQYGLVYSGVKGDDILSGLEKCGMEFLRYLPDEYFDEQSQKFSAIQETFIKYLKNYVAETIKSAKSPTDFGQIEFDVSSQMTEYKKLVEQRQSVCKARKEFVEKMTAKIDEEVRNTSTSEASDQDSSDEQEL